MASYEQWLNKRLQHLYVLLVANACLGDADQQFDLVPKGRYYGDRDFPMALARRHVIEAPGRYGSSLESASIGDVSGGWCTRSHAIWSNNASCWYFCWYREVRLFAGGLQ